MTGTLLHDGAVAVVDGKIAALGNPRDVIQQFPEAPVRTFDDAVLMPGLINAHTHLELTKFDRPELPPDGFVGWVLELRRRMMNLKDPATFIAESVASGIDQCVRFGVTSVGDVAFNVRTARQILNASPLKGISFGEVLGMAGRSEQFEPLFQQAIDLSMQREGLRAGIEPHAPYSLSIGGYRRSVEYARKHNLPICTHLAETPDEAEFLAQHSGPFRRLWQAIGGWTDDVETFDGGPIRFAESTGLLDVAPVLAHCNYIDDDELELLSGKRVSIVYCPRTHGYFAHRPHRFREMMGRGINVAIGTDSAMSAGDLNLLEDLRLVHRIAPEMNPRDIWQMATINAARALGMESSVGTIEPGKSADFAMFSAVTEDPLSEVLQGQSNATGVWIDGVKI